MTTPASIPVRNPRSGAIDTTLHPPSAEELSSLAARLRAYQPVWAAEDIMQRAQALERFAAALTAHKPDIGAALMADTGRRAIAFQEVDGVIGALRGWAARAPSLNAVTRETSRVHPTISHTPHLVPYALVGVISPWNFPLTLALIDAIPALLAGCAVLVKPSEVAPRFAAPLRTAIAEGGLDKVLAFVDGGGPTGAALIENVDAVCFTGSVATGRKVAAAAAARFIPAFLELGGKDPLIILKSADMERAVSAALRGSVLATGQACQSIERIYVDRAIHDEFVSRLAAAARAVRLNYPDVHHGEIGPLIWDRQAAIIQHQIDDAVAKGATVLSGGKVETLGGGAYLKPTVLTGVTQDMAIMQDETFGPVLPVTAFDTVDDAVRLANDSIFGLSAAVIAGTEAEARAVAERIDAGAVSINDAALTAMFYEAEKHSFKLSGMGGSRMGPAGYSRFFRKKALIFQAGTPRPLSAYAEDTLP